MTFFIGTFAVSIPLSLKWHFCQYMRPPVGNRTSSPLKPLLQISVLGWTTPSLCLCPLLSSWSHLRPSRNGTKGELGRPLAVPALNQRAVPNERIDTKKCQMSSLPWQPTVVWVVGHATSYSSVHSMKTSAPSPCKWLSLPWTFFIIIFLKSVLPLVHEFVFTQIRWNLLYNIPWPMVWLTKSGS